MPLAPSPNSPYRVAAFAAQRPVIFSRTLYRLGRIGIYLLGMEEARLPGKVTLALWTGWMVAGCIAVERASFPGDAVWHFYAVKQRSTGRRYPERYLAVYAAPYLIWLLIGQNVSNTRHVLPIIPALLILISYGLCKVYETGGRGISPALLLIFALAINVSIASHTVVARYHNTIPAPVQLIRFIESHFEATSTRIYCGEERRFLIIMRPCGMQER